MKVQRNGETLADLGAIREQAPLFGAVASDPTAYRVIERIAPECVTIDLDATLLGSHSEKEGAAGNFKGGFGFHPMLAYFEESSEALEQIPAERIEGSRSCCGPTPPLPSTSCSSGRARAGSATRSASTSPSRCARR